MRLTPLGVLSLLLLSTTAEAAMVSGTVTGPDGKPFRAAFVQARNEGMKMTVSVLSDNQGRYVVENLPEGNYKLSIRAIGYKADPKEGVKLTQNQELTQDFALQTGTVDWSDLSINQGKQLFPNAPGKQTWAANCTGCHGFQHQMAPFRGRGEDEWKVRVDFMRGAMHSSLGERNGFDDKQAAEVVSFLTATFGPNSPLPKSPTEMPNYKDTVINFSDEALKIVYVDYDMPGPTRFPWTARPDKFGFFNTPEYGISNKFNRFDPKTGEMKEFALPHNEPALIHSAVPAPDGSVWLAEAGTKRLGHWDPKTGKVTEYQDDWRKHTIQVHPDGSIWSTGGLTRFDPKTEKFTHIKEVPSAYGIGIDQGGTVWFTEMTKTGTLGKVDPNTLKVTKYIPPFRDRPRRMQIADDGSIWFAVFDDGRIGHFDPKAETFKDYPLPHARSSPYGFGIAADKSIWYSSYDLDLMGQLDPASGKVIEYPMPYTDNGMRDFFLGVDGKLWYATPPNNKIGYFFVSNRQRSASR